MVQLTRRRDPDARHECWQVAYFAFRLGGGIPKSSAHFEASLRYACAWVRSWSLKVESGSFAANSSSCTARSRYSVNFLTTNSLFGATTYAPCSPVENIVP
jgi:hypothetical protein